jgi:hypothetical protein
MGFSMGKAANQTDKNWIPTSRESKEVLTHQVNKPNRFTTPFSKYV